MCQSWFLAVIGAWISAPSSVDGGRCGAHRAHLADVGAGAECFSGAGQFHDPDVRIAGERGKRLGEKSHHLRGQRVSRLLAIERQRGDTAGVAFNSEHRHHIRNTP